jgi:hypothetical protein
MTRAKKHVEESILRAVRGAMALLAEEAISETPVDTSRLVTNWQISVGSLRVKEVTVVYLAPGSKGGGASTFAFGEAATAAARNAAMDIKMTTRKVYLANNTPYAYAVEFYGSTAAMEGKMMGQPAAMLRGAIGDWDKMVERAAR